MKVLFQLEPGTWHGSASETLWAERVDQRRFRLRNVPFFVFGVSAEDVVFARAAEGIYEFEGISIRGGHSTYRIITNVAGSDESFGQKWQALEQLGCTYEQGPGRLKAVDVPPRANIYKVYEVYELLEQGEHEGDGSLRRGIAAILWMDGAQRERDLVIPKGQGGDGTPANRQILCCRCNLEESDTRL